MIVTGFLNLSIQAKGDKDAAGLAASVCMAQSKNTKPFKNHSKMLTNAFVIELVKTGLDKDQNISKVGNSQSSFGISTTSLIRAITYY